MRYKFRFQINFCNLSSFTPLVRIVCFVLGNKGVSQTLIVLTLDILSCVRESSFLLLPACRRGRLSRTHAIQEGEFVWETPRRGVRSACSVLLLIKTGTAFSSAQLDEDYILWRPTCVSHRKKSFKISFGGGFPNEILFVSILISKFFMFTRIKTL
jgi:hypothetical protein